MCIQGEGTIQGCESLGVTLGRVYHTITQSQVPRRRCLYSSLSLHPLSYIDEVANHLTGLSVLRPKLPAGLDGGCGWAGADPCCAYFTVYFCTLPSQFSHITPSPPPKLRWTDEPTLLSTPEPGLIWPFCCLVEVGEEPSSFGPTSGVLPSSDVGGGEAGRIG